MREVVNVTHGLDCNPGADFETRGLGTVADEAGAPDQLDQGDVQRRLEPAGRRVQRGERDDVTGARHRGVRHLDRVTRAPPRGRRGDEPADRTAGGGQAFDHCNGCLEAGLYRGWPEIGATWLRTSDSSVVVFEPVLAGLLQTVSIIALPARSPSCSCPGRRSTGRGLRCTRPGGVARSPSAATHTRRSGRSRWPPAGGRVP